MMLIATGDPSANLDETGEVIELHIPSGDGESVTLALTPNQSLRLERQLNTATLKFYATRQACEQWQAENVLAFPSKKGRGTC